MKKKANQMRKKMMKQMKKRNRVNNKPIGEGYTFFCLATFAGYIVNFIPDGRTAAKLENQEYTHHNEFGK
eukprot:15325005-Ditylum_brightwellii.AAC.1